MTPPIPDRSATHCEGGTAECACPTPTHAPQLVVLTGGPGAGKTAVLEMVRRAFCRHVVVLPEAASVVFGGGFPRRDELPLRRAAQRAIACVQRELERAFVELREAAVILCDRGTLDGLAYWPDAPESFFDDLGSARDDELRRYAAVIHLRSPSAAQGYDHRNPLRIENAATAARLDATIAEAWSGHPRRFFVESAPDFLTKVKDAVERIRDEVPPCCRAHRVLPAEGARAPAE
jgi:predicted ATPase